MEEDIKILEEILTRDIEDTEGTKIMKKAIRNLIARYKDLEKLAEGIEKIRDITIPAKTDFIIVMRENYLPYIKNDFIPKSKVKEKIKKLKEEAKSERVLPLEIIEEQNRNINYKIKVLQELLED